MAKTLVQLKRLVVRECDKMKEIVENEGGGDHQATDNDEIIFTKLRSLHLRRLPNLKSFSTASNDIKFPSFEEMEAIECPEMEFFCKIDLTTERLKRVKVDYCRSYWENNLNATVQKMFIETYIILPLITSFYF